MEVDYPNVLVAKIESAEKEEDLTLELALREEFVENLANLAIVSPVRIQELYQKYVKRPRKYKCVYF